MGRWLILLAFLLLIGLAFYFGILHVREAGGSVTMAGSWLPARPVRTAAHPPGLGASQIVVLFAVVLIVWSAIHQGPKGRFRN